MTHVDMTAMGDSVKMLRETFCVAQQAIGEDQRDRWEEHVNRLGRLADICDEHRPIGEDGRHGTTRCTPTCGCEDNREATTVIKWNGNDEAYDAIEALLRPLGVTILLDDIDADELDEPMPALQLRNVSSKFPTVGFITPMGRIRIEGDSFAILPPKEEQS